MEIPEINMISLQNPSLISRLISIPSGDVVRVYSFWKWGALIFAIFAALGGLIRRLKVVLFRFQTGYKRCLIEEKLVDLREEDEISLDSSDDDEGEDEDERDDERRATTSFGGVDDDFRVSGGVGTLRRRRRRDSGGERFDWSEFTSGKSVVKLWDGLSSSFSFRALKFSDSDRDAVVSEWSYDSGLNPAVVLTAEGNGSHGGATVLRGYDARVRRYSPALYAEWLPLAAGNGFLTAGDVRNVKIPLDNGEDTWWDADAVSGE